MTRHGEEVISHTEATSSMPIIGELIIVMGHLYRCVEIRYADATETQANVPELRVRYKQEDGDE